MLLPVLRELSQQDESQRLYFACALVHRMFDQWQLPFAERERMLAICRDAFSSEFRADKQLLVQLDQHYRLYRLLVHDALTTFVASPERLQYEQHTRELVARLRNTITDGQQTDELLIPLLHMLLNRIFPTENRRHEYVVYHLLLKEYTSLLKRNRQSIPSDH